MPVRFRKTEVLGREVLVRETMDPEINDRVENASVVGLTSEEIDAMRCAANGEKHVPIQRAEELRKARPRKRASKQRDVGQVLIDLVKGSLHNDGADIADDPQIAESLGVSDDLDAMDADTDMAIAEGNAELFARGEAPPPPGWAGGSDDDDEFDDDQLDG